MKIINLQAENVKRLVAVNITPDGNVVEITGRNGQGKTSVLDAIWWALTGKGNIQSRPIRAGENEAHIILELGDPDSPKRLKVTRKFRLKKPEEGAEPDPTEFTTSVTVENEDGMKAGSPQEMLDGMLGALAFDPLAFLHMDAKKRVETLKALTGLDFTEIDAAAKAAFSERTDVNREADSFQAQANAIIVPADAPEEKVSIDALIAQLEEAGETNAAVERAKAAEQTFQDETGRIREGIDQAEAQVARMKTALEEAETHLAGLKEGLKEREAIERPAIPDRVDTADLRQQIEQARAANNAVDLRARRQELEEKARAKKERAAALTAELDAHKAKKAQMVADAEMPIPGLDFGEEGVLLNGQPFEQASDAEQLQASIAIAAKMNPKLRVIRVRDGSLMDSDAMAALGAFAQQHDLQVWIETVASGRPGAVVIEDGHVLGADEPQQPKLV